MVTKRRQTVRNNKWAERVGAIQGLINKVCEFGPITYYGTKGSRLYATYVEECERTGQERESRQYFYWVVESMVGVVRTWHDGVTYFSGLRLRNEL